MVQCEGSLFLDVCRLDDWPPFLGIRFHERGKCLGRLPLARENLHPKIAERTAG
jgi:hypothetical protein